MTSPYTDELRATAQNIRRVAQEMATMTYNIIEGIKDPDYLEAYAAPALEDAEALMLEARDILQEANLAL